MGILNKKINGFQAGGSSVNPRLVDKNNIFDQQSRINKENDIREDRLSQEEISYVNNLVKYNLAQRRIMHHRLAKGIYRGELEPVIHELWNRVGNGPKGISNKRKQNLRNMAKEYVNYTPNYDYNDFKAKKEYDTQEYYDNIDFSKQILNDNANLNLKSNKTYY